MTVTTNASEMRRAIAQRREEHRESQDSKTAGDGMIRERDFEMPLFLYDKTSSRFNPNVDLSPASISRVSFDEYRYDNLDSQQESDYALYSVPVVSSSSTGRKKVIAVLQVLWKGHSFVPRSAAFMVDSIAKIIFRIVHNGSVGGGRPVSQQQRESAAAVAPGTRQSPRRSGAQNERIPPSLDLFRAASDRNTKVVVAKPLSQSSAAAAAKMAKSALLKHRWSWLVRLLMLSKRKNQIHKLVMAVIEKRRVDSEERLQEELSAMAAQKSELEVKAGSKDQWLQVRLRLGGD
jgi:hypothetical protein